MTSTFYNMEDETVRYVISKNLHRRHLTNGQKAEIGIRAKKMQAKMAQQRRRATLKKGGTIPVPENFPEREKGDARDKAAKALGISGRMIDHAEKVFGENTTATPELQKAVRKGNASVSAAAKVAELPRELQQQAVAEGKKGVAKAAKQTLQYPPKKRVHKSSTVTTLRTKDMMKIYLPRNHSQLFAVELRDNFTKDYLRECFKDLEKLWDDTEGDSSCIDPATRISLGRQNNETCA